MATSGYLLVAIAMLVIGLVLLIVTIGLFFAFDVPTARGELNGKNRQKRIEKLKKLSAGNSTSSTSDLYNQDLGDIDSLVASPDRSSIPSDASDDEASTTDALREIEERLDKNAVEHALDMNYDIGYDDNGSSDLSTGVFEDESSILPSFDRNNPFASVRSVVVLSEATSLD